MALARIGIGSNVGEAAAHVRSAFTALARVGSVTARSSLYRTKAWGITDQPDFINAAALVETPLAPHRLLVELKTLERELGRRPTFRWGPRVIDLDILAYDDLALNGPDLTLPHARLYQRAFALAPLAEIDPAFAPAYRALDAAARAEVVRLTGDGLPSIGDTPQSRRL
jgi:2-amino-4-hydroxy-6-hydroxymethyldihydropteridine diphosphokinase